MKLALIFPPAVDPRSPYLALPSLAAILRAAGVETELVDLNVEGVLALLRAESLAESGIRLRQKAPSLPPGNQTAARRLNILSDSLPERVDNALAVLRSSEYFYDANQFNAARETIFNCLDLVSLASLSKVRYNIFPVCYDVDGIDIQSLGDLIKVSVDRGANLFADHWENETFPRLEAQNPDWVGITITNRQQIIPGLTLARLLKSRGHFVIIGGCVYTKFADQLMQIPTFFEYFAQGVVVNEGETAVLELIDQLQGARDFSLIPNFLYLNKGKVRRGRVHIEDLAALPTPDFEGLPLDHYLTPETVLPVLFGKGCYFNRCKFCDIPHINRISAKSYRVRPPGIVVADLQKLNERFGCRHFDFTDETLSPKLLEKLADELKSYSSKNYKFTGYARLERAFNAELCQKLSGMGMKKLFFGLESGAQETLDHMDKGIQIAEVPKVLKNCRDAGINFHIFSIVGFPEESEESARKTLNFFQTNAPTIDHPGNSFDIHPFGLELRTRYAEEAETLGVRIEPEALAKEFVIGVGKHWTNTRGLSRHQVIKLLNEGDVLLGKIYRNYHASPHQLWPAFEEFAILYCDRYTNREFYYRTCLPSYTDPRRYRLFWNPAALISSNVGSAVCISSRNGSATVGAGTFDILSCNEYRTVRNWLSLFYIYDTEGLDNRLFYRGMIDDLIAKGLLFIEGEG